MSDHQHFAETLHDLVTGQAGAVAEKAFTEYFATDKGGFTGSQFEYMTGRDTPNAITARDIVAISMLSAKVPPRLARWILGDEGRAKVGILLEQVPTNVMIYQPDAEALLAPGGPLWELWDLLKTGSWPSLRDGGNGLGGKTRRSKLMHAKRPHLVLIYDSVVENLLPSENHWEAFRRALSDSAARGDIEQATKSAPAHLSLLRRIDIVLWRIGKTRAA